MTGYVKGPGREERLVPFKLFDWAYCPGVANSSSDHIQELAKLADPEQWHFDNEPEVQKDILYNYLHHTFNRIFDQNKIAFSQSKLRACFNTGLYTEYYESIFGVLVKNKHPNRQLYFLVGFAPESQMTFFPELPDRANYFQNIADIIFDCRLDIRVSTAHILQDRGARLPEELRNPQSLQGAITMTKRKIRSNYRLAVPQFFPRTKTIQLLIPLFGNQNEVEAVVPIQKDSTGSFYTGFTCLNIDQAYNNARLLARLESPWLKPRRPLS